MATTFLPRALAPMVGRSGIDGIPARYNDGREWLRHGVRRRTRSVILALVLGWTGTWLAFWGALIGAIIGVLVALHLAGGNGIAITSAVGPLAVFVGLFLGAAFGIVFVLRFIFVVAPWQPFVAILIGFIVSAALMMTLAAYERVWLRLRGYRRLSRDEVRVVAPLVRNVADAMNLDGLPRFAMADLAIPNAWACMRTIVLTKGLIATLTPDELQAILAHELHHWRSGDSVGDRMVWCASLPLVIPVNVGRWLSGAPPQSDLAKSIPGVQIRHGFAFILGWLIAWPGWLILRYIIAPTMNVRKRDHEYEADAAAAAIGMATPLRSALLKLSAFESGRTGWEQAMAATHPPTALRLEALQEPKEDDVIYQEDALRGPSRGDLFRLLTPFVPRRFTKGQPVAR
jgi:Zn-dependent protease with chaperone function